MNVFSLINVNVKAVVVEVLSVASIGYLKVPQAVEPREDSVARPGDASPPAIM